MILQRIANTIRRQHWGTLAIELLVVVAGIFIGLQVDDWNEDRKQRNQEANYLHLVARDVSEMQADLASLTKRSKARMSRMFSALRAVEACDDSPEARSAIADALTTYQVSPPLNVISATYDEMVSSGALARLRDPALKRAIVSAFSHIETMNRSVNAFRISMSLVDEVVWEFATFSYSTDGEDVQVDFDAAELCGNRRMHNALVEMIDMQEDWNATAGRAAAALGSLAELLGGASGAQSLSE
jgi:hypothetical protein